MEKDVNKAHKPNRSKEDSLEKLLDDEIQKLQLYEEEIQVLYETIKSKDEEIEQLKARLRMFENNQSIQKPTEEKRKVDEHIRLINESIAIEEIDEVNHPNIEQASTTEKLIVDKIDRSIDKRFESMQTKLIKTINENLNMSHKSSPTYASTLQGNGIKDKDSDGTNIWQDNQDRHFKNIIMNAKNEEIMEKKDKERRAANAIIHGKEEQRNHDCDIMFVQELSVYAQADVSPLAATRIGTPTESKKRDQLKFALKMHVIKENLCTA